MGYIYIIGNKINSKKYVGQTSVSADVRWGQHKQAARTGIDGHFYRAIRKHGVSNFFIESSFETPDSDISDVEIETIAECDSYQNGYNSTLGGGGGLKYTTDDLVEAYQRLGSLENVAEELGINRSHLSRRLRAAGIKIVIPLNNANSVEVHQYELTGKYVRSWESAAEASRSGYNPTNISQCCNAKRKSTGGYQWSHQKCEDIGLMISNRGKSSGRKIYQYSKDWELIAQHSSITSASKEVGVHRTTITRHKDTGTLTKGFYWTTKTLEEKE